MRRTAGRRRCNGIAQRSQQRRQQRDKRKASTSACALVKELTRLRIILKTKLTRSSDCRRMMRLAAALRCRGATLNATFLLLLVDRALRRPGLTAKLLRLYTKHQANVHNSMQAAWQAVVDIRRLPEARQQNAVFWKGPAGLNCRDFIASLAAPIVVDVISQLKLESQCLDARLAVDTLSMLPHVSRYSAFSMVRILPACLNIQLRGTEAVARGMSNNVFTMEKVMPLLTARRLAAKGSGCGVRDVSDGDATLLLCESSKALVVLGVLPAASSEWSEQLLQEKLASKATTALLKALRSEQPIADAELRKLNSRRAEEGRLIDEAMPQTQAPWDRDPHFCVGSEMVAGLLSRTLQGVGWLDPEFAADLFDDLG